MEDLRFQARELQDFFLGTYADKAIEAALSINNEDVIKMVIEQYSSDRQLIEDANVRTEAHRAQ